MHLMRSNRVCGWDLAEWWKSLTANAKVAIVLGSIPASSDTVESEGRQMKQCWIQYIEKKKNQKIPLLSMRWLGWNRCIPYRIQGSNAWCKSWFCYFSFRTAVSEPKCLDKQRRIPGPQGWDSRHESVIGNLAIKVFHFLIYLLGTLWRNII